jgi:hypothetical protein
MKHQTLRIVASLLTVIAWVIGGAEAVVSVLVGIGAATVAAKIGLVLGGFIIAALSVIMMLALSKLIYLLIDIEEDLSKMAKSAGGK